MAQEISMADPAEEHDAHAAAARPALPGEGGPRFPVVAIGASAGGLAALSRLFEAMPAGAGFGFVVIVHLAPTHASHLPELLARHTEMPVTQVQDAEPQPLQRDHVYVIPPNRSLELRAGQLCVSAGERLQKIPLPIDRFFRSLAEDRQEQAICIVLSGSGADGSQGLRDVKAEGGLVLAQSPETAEHDGMPRSAIATGLVDIVLPVEQMPRALLDYARHALLLGAPIAAGALAAADGDVLDDILALLRLRAGHDFRGYKQAMVMRRVRRRMGLARSHRLADYHALLRDSAEEVGTLCKDLLIGVTAFFREPEAWAALQHEVLAPLVRGAEADANFRIWVPACSTGEEAYTVGMLMAEQMTAHAHRGKVSIFATDADPQALDVGRNGRFAEQIAATVSPERLARFFAHQGNQFAVRKALREMVVFAPQNLLADPPFSRLDLICCRNLLIYLEPAQQHKLMLLFHFALNPGGHLMLGKSESAGHQHGLFEPAAKRWRIYRRVGPPRRAAIERVPGVHGGAAVVRGAARPLPARHDEFGELVRQLLLAHHAPAAVLIDREQHVLYIAGQAEDFLVHPRGAPTGELLSIVREGLRVKLRALLHQTLQQETMASGAAPLTHHGRSLRVEIGVMPVPEAVSRGMLLVTFSSRPGAAPPRTEGNDNALHLLEDELQITRRDLQAAIEDLESGNEELKVANEEAMSMNEELQSANEELETSKEELQSLNEELTTVNSQMEEKVVELEAANNDLTNLLTSTHMPTLFLDRGFRIKRFTPALSRLFSLIASDIDRPITDIASRFPIAELLDEARRVLDTLVPIEREMRSGDEQYLRRVLPYRTSEDHIEGVVVTFTDISELRRTSSELQQSQEHARGQAQELDLLNPSGRIGLALFDRALNCVRINEVLAAAWDIDALPAVGRAIGEVLPPPAAPLVAECRRVFASGQAVLDLELKGPSAREPGVERVWLTSLHPLKDSQGIVHRVGVTVEELNGARRRSEGEMRRHRALQRAVDSSRAGIAIARPDCDIAEANDALLLMLGYERDDLRAAPLNWRQLTPPEDATADDRALAAPAGSDHSGPVEKVLMRKDGSRAPVLVTRTDLDAGSGLCLWLVVDLSASRQADARALRAAQDLTAQIEQAREEDRARIAHEIHDELGAALTGIRMHFQAARADAAARGQALPAALDAMPELIDGAGKAINRIVGDLRPSVLDHLGVWAALEWYAERVLPGAGIGWRVETEPALAALSIDAERATAIFRIAQEALTNVVRHAQAQQVTLRAALDDATVVLEVHDDGHGIAAHPSLDAAAGGLMGMRERARRLGGELSVSSAPTRGTTVLLRLPLEG
jgi:two-component system, chemotaxis family, CheB/CheR fusion protein